MRHDHSFLRKVKTPLKAINILLLSLFTTSVILTVVVNPSNPEEAFKLILVLGLVLSSLKSLQGLFIGFETGNSIPFVFHFSFVFWFFGSGFLTLMEKGSLIVRAPSIVANEHDALLAIELIGIFYIVALISHAFFRRRTRSASVRIFEHIFATKSPLGTKEYLSLSLLFFFVSMLFYIIVSGGITPMIRFIFLSRSGQTPWDSQGNYGTSYSWVHFLTSSLLVLSSIFSSHILLNLKSSIQIKTIAAIVTLLSTSFLSIESGTRGTLLLCLAPALLAFLFNKDIAIKKRLILNLTMIIFFIIFSSFQRTYRTEGDLRRTGELTELEYKVDSDFVFETSIACAVSDELGEPIHEFATLVIIAGPIPRVLWENKPEPIAYVIYSKYRFGYDITKQGGNALPSIVGQYYLSWGILGVVEAAIFIGFFFAILDARRQRKDLPSNPILLHTISFILFMFFRYVSFSYIPLFYIFFGIHKAQHFRHRRLK